MLRNISIRDTSLWIAIYCLVCCLLNIMAYAPGFMSPDSVDVYEQAIRGHYHDWHPPIFALLTHVLLKIYESPITVLILQMLLLWGSVYILLETAKDKWWRVLIFLLPWLPFVQNFSGYIIKDSHMALSLLLATAIIFRAYSSGRKLRTWELVFTVLLVIYGGIVRPNGLPAVLPFFWLIARSFTTNKTRIAVYSIILLGLTLLANKLQYIIAKPGKTHAIAKLYMHDLTGIFVRTGDNVFPTFLYTEKNFDTGYLRANYNEATFDNMWWNDSNKYVLQGANEQQVQEAQSYWQDAIAKHPFAYIKNHTKGFSNFLRITKRTDEFNVVVAYIHGNQFGLSYERKKLGKLFLRPIEKQKNMPYMRPWFWLLLNMILFLFIKRVGKPYRSVYVALLLSSLLYLLPTYFIFQVDTDFRYMYWNCVSCSLATIILISRYNKKAAV